MIRYDALFCSVNWSARAESMDEHLNQLQNYFKLISSLGPLYKNWYKKSGKKRVTGEPLDTGSGDSLRQLLDSGISKRDDNKMPIPELGHYFSLWNGATSTMAVRCGMYAKDISVKNVAYIEALDGVMLDKDAKDFLVQVVEIWAAESGRIELTIAGDVSTIFFDARQ